MNIVKKFNKNIFLDIIKWVGAIFLLMLLGITNYIYYDYDVFLKKIIVFSVISIAVCILLTTISGRLLIAFGKEAYIELQKVVWPSYQDTLHTTVVVTIVTVIISVILWGLDTILVHLISFGLRL